jgi:hypothetical protein
MIAVQAHFDGKVIVPDEPVELPKGQALTIHIAVEPEGGWKSVLDWIVANRVDDPNLSTDLSYQHDHYLYGTPKKKPPRRKPRKP